MVDRIATFSQSQKLIDSNMRIQSKYATTQTQVSSGLKSDSYQGIAKETASLLNFENQYQKMVSRSENAQTALDRTESMYSAVSSMIDIGQSFLSDLSAAISGTGYESSDLQTVAEQGMEQIASLLNTQMAGRYLFSGSATQTAAVDLSSYTGVTSVPSSADTSYYAGNDYVQSVELDDGFSLNYGVTADNEAFESLLRAYSLAATYPNDETALLEAYDLLNTALDDLASLNANISQDSQTLDQVIDDHLSELNLLDTMISDLKEVDLAEVSVKLQELETQLEASYSVTTTLLNLKLSDYL